MCSSDLSEWTEPAEADMRVADTAGMVESAPAASEPPSAKDIIEEYRRKRLAKEAKEREERETRLAARMAEVANEATTSPAPEPEPPAPSLEPEAAPPLLLDDRSPMPTSSTTGVLLLLPQTHRHLRGTPQDDPIERVRFPVSKEADAQE